MKSKIYLLCLIISVFFLTTSCVKDEYKFENIKPTEWNPNLASPLLSTELTLWNLMSDLDSNLISVDDNNFITLRYQQVLFSEIASNVLIIPDQVFNFNTSFNNPFVIPPGDTIELTYTPSYDFILETGQTIDSVFIKSGSFDINITSNLNTPSKVILEVHEATRNGLPFIDTLELLTPNSFNSISLNNTKLTFSQIGGTNRFNYTLKLIQYGTGAPNLSPYNFNMAMRYTNIDFKAFYGSIGTTTLSINDDTLNLGITSSVIQGSFNVNDPRVNLVTRNSFGIPMQTNLHNLDFIRTTPSFQKVSLTGFPNPWAINSPSAPGQTATTTLNLNNTNSNLAAAINLIPQMVNAKISATTNPQGPAPNFIMDTSRFEVQVGVEFPLYGSLNELVMNDTIPMTFNINNETLDYLEWILVKANMENRFPLDVNLQVYFYDNNFNFIDSLLAPAQQLLYAGLPGPAPDYKVTNPTRKSVVIKVEKNRLTNYNQITQAVLKGKISTANQGGTVKFYSDYNIKLQLGAQIKLSVNP